MDAQSRINEAKATASGGDHASARAILRQVIQQDPQNAGAWLAMAEVLENPDHVIECLERVLNLQPDNETARQKLIELNHPAADIPAFLLEYYEPEPEETVQATVEGRTSEFAIPKPSPSEHNLMPKEGIEKAEAAGPPTPTPQEPQPLGQVEAPSKAKKRPGRWLEISLAVVAIMCLCVVGVLAIGQFGPSLSSSAGPTPTLEDVQVVIYQNVYAANAEDLDAYMDTIHPRAWGRSMTRSTMQELFEKYDLFYKITWLSVQEVTDKEARVAFALETRKVNGPAFLDNWITGVMILRLDGREWKIYDQEVGNVTYFE